MRDAPLAWWVQAAVDEAPVDSQETAARLIGIASTEEADTPDETRQAILRAEEAAQPELRPAVAEGLIHRGTNVAERFEATTVLFGTSPASA